MFNIFKKKSKKEDDINIRFHSKKDEVEGFGMTSEEMKKKCKNYTGYLLKSERMKGWKDWYIISMGKTKKKVDKKFSADAKCMNFIFRNLIKDKIKVKVWLFEPYTRNPYTDSYPKTKMKYKVIVLSRAC